MLTNIKPQAGPDDEPGADIQVRPQTARIVTSGALVLTLLGTLTLLILVFQPFAGPGGGCGGG